MRSIEAAYLRARKRRLIKTIICTACVSVIAFLYQVELTYIFVAALLTWFIAWQLFSIAVDNHRQIHFPGGTQCRKRWKNNY